MKRYCVDRKFPPYSYIHGKNINPNKKGGYRDGIADPIVLKIDPDDYSSHDDYLFAIDLINHGYYWESHVYFEAIWHAHNRKGHIAEYCKSLVKIAAGAIKVEQNKKESAKRLFYGSRTILKKLPKDFFLGIDIEELIKITQKWESSRKQYITLKFSKD